MAKDLAVWVNQARTCGDDVSRLDQRYGATWHTYGTWVELRGIKYYYFLKYFIHLFEMGVHMTKFKGYNFKTYSLYYSVFKIFKYFAF